MVQSLSQAQLDIPIGMQPTLATLFSWCMIDSGWTVSGFPSSDVSASLLSFCLSDCRPPASSFFFLHYLYQPSRAGPLIAAAAAAAFLTAQAEIRPVEIIGMPPIRLVCCRAVLLSGFLIGIYYHPLGFWTSIYYGTKDRTLQTGVSLYFHST